MVVDRHSEKRSPVQCVLIVEDNADLAANLGEYLEAEGWLVDYAPDGRTGLALALASTEGSQPYSAVVLDLTLPRLDGLEVARQLRQELAVPPPILMLTARDSLEDKLEGFAAGADDYLLKPFSLAELGARLRVLVRRSARSASNSRELEVLGLRLLPNRFEAYRDGRKLALTPIGFAILELLMERHPEIVTRRELEQSLWGEDPPRAGTLRTHLYNLRGEVQPDGSQPILLTIRGVGFRLEASDG